VIETSDRFPNKLNTGKQTSILELGYIISIIAPIHRMLRMELYFMARFILSKKYIENKIWLPFYSQVFNYLEIDSTFYAIPSELMVRNWNRRTPSNFRFTKLWIHIVNNINPFRPIPILVLLSGFHKLYGNLL